MLIDWPMHDMAMFGLLFLLFIVALVPLAYVAGVDSRIDEVARRRGYNG